MTDILPTAIKPSQEIKPLTSIRGIAAVLVMIYHFHQLDNIPFAPLLTFVKKGYLCVDLFFVLSGFVMALTYARQFAGRYRWLTHEAFLLKRIGRVYPLYFLIMVGVSVYSLVVYGGYEHVHRPAVHLLHPLKAHISNLLMIQAWGFGETIGGPTWSISAEFAAYILFPALVAMALSSRKGLTVLLTFFSCAALYYVSITPEIEESVRNGQLDVFHGLDPLLVLRCLGGFCLGLIAFRLTRTQRFSAFFYTDTACGIIVLALLAMMATNQNDLVIYPLLPLLILSLYGNRGKAAALFSARIPYTLGVLSYSIYLLHEHFLVLLTQMQKHLADYIPAFWANSIAALVTYSLIFIGANITYRYIEKPGRVWFRRFARKVDGKN